MSNNKIKQLGGGKGPCILLSAATVRTINVVYLRQWIASVGSTDRMEIAMFVSTSNRFQYIVICRDLFFQLKYDRGFPSTEVFQAQTPLLRILLEC